MFLKQCMYCPSKKKVIPTCPHQHNRQTDVEKKEYSHTIENYIFLNVC